MEEEGKDHHYRPCLTNLGTQGPGRRDSPATDCSRPRLQAHPPSRPADYTGRSTREDGQLIIHHVATARHSCPRKPLSLSVTISLVTCVFQPNKISVLPRWYFGFCPVLSVGSRNPSSSRCLLRGVVPPRANRQGNRASPGRNPHRSNSYDPRR